MEHDPAHSSPFSTNALVAGAVAGLTVDLTLFPIDTIKTRLQSELGLWRTGGFRRIYAGIPSVMIGSAPGASVFFCTYESSKRMLALLLPPGLGQVAAASIAETAACFIRVPMEVLKQRSQASGTKMFSIFRTTLSRDGFRGLYCGYAVTLCREIPFSTVQFPLWEALKREVAQRNNRPTNPFEGACCGVIAGAVAGAVTTPLDVAKTRIMLAQKLKIPTERKVLPVLKDIWAVRGVKGLFAGLVPRTLWLSLGGFIFLGAYESTTTLLYKIEKPPLRPESVVETERKSAGLETERLAVTLSCSLLNLWEKYVVQPNLEKRNIPRTFEDVKKRAEEEAERIRLKNEAEERVFFEKTGQPRYLPEHYVR